MREVQYLIQLANILLVKKKNEKIWIELGDNEACPKGDFPVPHMALLISI